MCTKAEVKEVVHEELGKHERHEAVEDEKVKVRLEELDKKLSDGVLDRNGIHHALKALHKGQEKILTQTTLHNARMGKMELWRSYMLGGLSVLTILVVPIAIIIVIRLLNI